MANGYLYPGRVVKMDPDGPIVMVPLLGGDALWGPVESSVADLAVSDRVICATMGSSANDLRIIGRTPGRAPTIGEIPGLAATLDSHTTRLEAVELDNATDQLVLDDHTTRLGAVESKNGQQDTRLTAVESKNAEQDGRLTATEGVANAAAPASTLATLRADTAGRVTTKGDLLVATASGVLARQPVGANGLALVADSAQAGGLVYAERRGVPLGLTGATAPTRYVGGTVSGPPTTGTFAVGDFVVTADAEVWVCTTAGSPGSWTSRSRNAGRGYLARGRRLTAPATTAATVGNWIRICELTATLVTGRAYEFGTYNLGAYSDQATEIRVATFITTNNTTPVVTAGNAQWAQYESPAGGRVKTMPVVGYYEAASAITLRVLIAIQANITVGGSIGMFCTADWPMDAWIRDVGPTGVGGFTAL